MMKFPAKFSAGAIAAASDQPLRAVGASVPVREPATARAQPTSRRVVWMGVLLAAICFEGAGRTFLRQVPSALFYFAKDIVLLSALAIFGLRKDVLDVGKMLYGRYAVFLLLALVWTIVQLFNPEQQSLQLGLFGLRSYWVWWLAPFIIASVLWRREDRNRATAVFAVFTILIALYATLQFASPPDAAINSYALYDGETIMQTSTVHATGRARVSGTFSFISGFADFTIFAPLLLVAMGLDARLRTRFLAMGSAALIASTAAMTGSRKGFILSAAGLAVILFRSGFIRSAKGRWTIAAIGLMVAFSAYRSTDAVDGVVSRFEGTDTQIRMQNELYALPPVALTLADYPLFGIGTGMQQSARHQLGLPTKYVVEEEFPRILVELGAIGYGCFWMARFGLIVALLRASRILKRAGQMGAAGGAMALAAMTMFNGLVFDHVSQSLFFASVGMILAATVEAVRTLKKPGRVGELRLADLLK